MKIKKIEIVILVSLMFINISVYAQTEQILDPVTITSSMAEKRSSETGRNITIIKGEYFTKLPVNSVDELLKFIPGIEIQSRGPQGSQSDITIRGGTFQQVLVILDGLRLNDPNTGHFSAYIPISPAEIDRIEILKGASSAIYGSDAVGGVINIITKVFNSRTQAESRKLNVQIAAGEYGLFNVNAGGYLETGRINLSAGVISNNAKGVMQRGARGFFHNTTASAGVRFKINPYWNLAIRSAFDSRDFAAQNFYTTFLSDTASEKVNSWWHQARLGFEKNNSKITLDAGYKELNDEYAFNEASAPNQSTSSLFQALFTFQQSMSEQVSIVTGFNFQKKSIASNDRGNHNINTAAPFVSLIQKVGNHISLQPSLRLEIIGNNKAELIPQLNASLKVKGVQLRASGGKSIRDADFTERFNNFNKQSVKSGRIGFQGLTAEQSWTYEGGFDWFSTNGIKLSGTFFQRFHTRLIDWVNTPYAEMPRKDNLVKGGIFALAKNIAEVNTTGVEADMQMIKKINKQQSVIFNSGLIWLHSKSSEDQPSFYISSHARFLANLMTIYNFGPAGISITAVYKNRQPQKSDPINAYVSKDYFLINLKGSYQVLQKKVTTFVQVDNAFDKVYSDLLGAPMPGRWFSGGIAVNLN
ncbi:MAG TPA: TonB-dependent receptor [Niabella sp.]|nr:TonB-dependent receptor [Chitinophagaceae bacterium]HRN46694.1 TonB-dependent receptor [Niabella sp.]HRO84025.1 TonB-dependent receptor [Niabella sp.]